jgi:hypothetical protein
VVYEKCIHHVLMSVLCDVPRMQHLMGDLYIRRCAGYATNPWRSYPIQLTNTR